MLRLTRLFRTACLLAALGLAGPSFAQTIDSATPINAAVGTTLTINGTGFGLTKPKVQLFDSLTNKKYVLKVETFSDTEITATIKKAVVADLMLQVIVKGAPAPAEGPALIQIESPLVTQLSAASAEPNAPLTILGDFFGTKKGKVRINGQNAKVVSWLMNEIQLLMPKKLANGFWPIVVDNKLGIDDNATIQVTGSAQKIGKAGITLLVDGNAVKLKYSAGQSVPGLVAAGGATGTNPAKVLVVAVPYSILNFDPPFVLDESDFFAAGFIYTETPKITSVQDALDPAKQPSVYFPQPGSTFELTVTAESGGQVGMEFEGTLKRIAGLNGPLTIFVEGSIIVDA